MSYPIIETHRPAGTVETLCGALGVSVSGYYAWRTRQPSQRKQTDGLLLTHIRAVYQDGRGLYGSPRIYAALRQQGVMCSRKRVARLMRQTGIHSRRRPKRGMHTTDSGHNRPVAPNLLKRNFSAEAPNEKWVGDIVGIWTDEGWLYLAALLDTYSGLIVGWAMSLYRDEALVTAALGMALARRQIPQTATLIHHTDRGSQYTADDYLALLKAQGIQVSMSDKGDPYDNAMMESFFSTLRAELTDLERFLTRQVARKRCSNSSKCFPIGSACIRLWAIAAHWPLKPTIYLESVSYSSSTKTGQDHYVLRS
jgi:putative transposase